MSVFGCGFGFAFACGYVVILCLRVEFVPLNSVGYGVIVRSLLISFDFIIGV